MNARGLSSVSTFLQHAAAWTPKSFDWEHDDIHDDDCYGNDDDDNNDCTFSN